MTQFRTSSLFHYTSFNTLKKILKEGIFPNYCKEDLSHDGFRQSSFIFGIPMVSFCDIPLTRTNDFRFRYGNHAIGLNKKWGIGKGVNPVFYIQNQQIFRFLRHILTSTELAGVRHKGMWVQRQIPGITFRDIQYDHNMNLSFYGYVKKYMGQRSKTEEEQCNYEENEWRYIVEETLSIPWYWNQLEYEEWRGSGDKPEATEALKNQKLTFTVEDISHIIVDKDEQIPKIIDYIRKLKEFGGTGKALTSDEMDMLFAKVTSIERIDKDY